MLPPHHKQRQINNNYNKRKEQPADGANGKGKPEKVISNKHYRCAINKLLTLLPAPDHRIPHFTAPFHSTLQQPVYQNNKHINMQLLIN